MTSPTCRQTERNHCVVALVGNPNTGKTTLFNALTGLRQHVGNYPGVTVDHKTGFLRSNLGHSAIKIVDLPGAYSLAANSADEAVVLDVLLGQQDHQVKPDLMVVVADATQLTRNLFLVSQLTEIGVPVVVALNMIDLAESSGLQVDSQALARELGVPVVPIVATKQKGINDLITTIFESMSATPPSVRIAFPACITTELNGLRNFLARADGQVGRKLYPIELLQTLLDVGGYHERRLGEQVGRDLIGDLAERRKRIQAAGESVVEVEARTRYAWINGVVDRVVSSDRRTETSRSEVVDRVLTHRVFGLIFLAVLMSACFQSIYVWAAPIMDAVDGLLNLLGSVVGAALPTGAFRSLLVDGVVAGVGAVLVFLPQILILFLLLAILEDCGYMARAAFLLDRWMGFFGLNGKSLIPLMSSFACAVPGIMAARTIEDRRDRLVTIVIAPLMSCSARLPVFILLISAFVPAVPILGGLIGLQAMTLLGMYLMGTVVAVLVAMVLRRTLLKGKPRPFLMELPTYKWPSVRTVFYRIYEQGKAFCSSAGTIIFAVTIVIWALGYYPRSASVAATLAADHATAQREHDERLVRIGEIVRDSGDAGLAAKAIHESLAALEARHREIDLSESGRYLHASMLGRMGRWIEPVVKPLGWDWRIGTAAIAAFPAREVVIATMGILYHLGGDQDETSVTLRERLHTATWPDGRPVFNLAVALSLMVFFALCCQCGGTLAVMKRETNSWRWPLFTFTYMTILAYVGALIAYQVTIRFI